MPLCPALMLRDKSFTGFNVAISVPDNKGRIFFKTKAGRSSEVNVFKISEDLAKSIEDRNCYSYDHDVVAFLKDSRNNETQVKPIHQATIPSFLESLADYPFSPRIYLAGHTNGIVGLIYFVTKKDLKKIKKAIKKTLSRKVKITPTFADQNIVITEFDPCQKATFDLDELLTSLSVPVPEDEQEKEPSSPG